MLTHDCPASVPLYLPVPGDRSWLAQLPACEAHRELLDEVVREVTPSYLMHGHYHMSYDKTVNMSYGPLRATGLACDTMAGNLLLLNTETMAWEV
jgi:hypothetical protein